MPEENPQEKPQEKKQDPTSLSPTSGVRWEKYLLALLMGLLAIPILLLMRPMNFLPFGENWRGISYNLISFFGPVGVLFTWIAAAGLLSLPAIGSGFITWLVTGRRRLIWVTFFSAAAVEFVYFLILPIR